MKISAAELDDAFALINEMDAQMMALGRLIMGDLEAGLPADPAIRRLWFRLRDEVNVANAALNVEIAIRLHGVEPVSAAVEALLSRNIRKAA